MEKFIADMNTIHGVTSRVVWDSAGRDIARAEIAFNHESLGTTTNNIVKQLNNGNPAIYCRGYKANEGIIEIDVRSVNTTQLNTIFEKINALF